MAQADIRDVALRTLKRSREDPVWFVRHVLKAEPTPQQIQLLQAVSVPGAHVAVKSGHGTGKAQPKTLSLMTPDGLRKWGDIQPGDVVFGADGKSTRVIARHERGVMDVYRVTFDDRSSTLCCGDHVWTVRGRAQRRVDKAGGASYEWVEMTTAEMIASGVKRPNGVAQARQWEIPQQGPAEFPAKPVPVAPYVIGAWLGDGGRTTPSITTGDPEVIDRIRELGYSVNLMPKQGTSAVACYVHGIVQDLRKLGIVHKYSYEKSVPRLYMENSPEVRAEVLRGLLDTDGEVDAKTASIGFSSCSLTLAEDVVWLARSLGGKARLFRSVKHPGYRKPNGERVRCRDCYRVSLQMPSGFKPFYIQRKQERVSDVQQRYLTRWVDSIEPVGREDCMCITVEADDGLYQTNDFIVTHNSSVLSWLILWFLLTHKDARVPCTAPSAHQLSDVLWSEVARWINGMHELFRPHVLWSSEAIRIKGAEQTQFAVARTARPEKPEALQGFHAPNMLFLIDEASGVPDAVFEVAQGALTSPDSRVVMTSNPTMLTGYFYEAFHRSRERWTRLTFSAEDSPIVAPAYCAEMAEKYGADSDMYKVRVLGEFPSASVMQLIPLPLVEHALGRHVGSQEYSHMPVILGCDVSYYGDDKSVVYLRQGLRSSELWSGREVDTVTFANLIARLWREHKADACFVDITGWGAGVVDTLRNLGFQPQGVPFGSQAGDAGRFANRRAEMWWLLKEWLEGGGVLPDDADLKDDLIGPQYFYTPNGKIALERKEDMKKRGLSSPDKADALALTFASPVAIRATTPLMAAQNVKVKYDVLNRRRK